MENEYFAEIGVFCNKGQKPTKKNIMLAFNLLEKELRNNKVTIKREKIDPNYLEKIMPHIVEEVFKLSKEIEEEQKKELERRKKDPNYIIIKTDEQTEDKQPKKIAAPKEYVEKYVKVWKKVKERVNEELKKKKITEVFVNIKTNLE